MQEYVLGFMFSKDKRYVLLIEKLKPEWQKGFLNGIGGKVEVIDCNSFIDAMIREFEEETSLRTMRQDWKEFARIQRQIGTNRFFCPCYVSFSDEIFKAQPMEKEQLILQEVEKVNEQKVLNNLRYIIPLALHVCKNLGMVNFNYSSVD